MKSTLERLLESISSPEIAALVRDHAPEAAGERLEGLIAARPGDAELHRSLGLVKLRLGDAMAAQSSCDTAFTSDPADHRNVLAVGLCLHGLKRFEDAERHYRRALERSRDRAELWNELGRALNNLGRVIEARDAFEKATELAPQEAEPWNNLGHVWRRLGDPSRAARNFERATEAAPDYAEAFFNLAATLLADDQPARAERALQKVLAVRPSDARAWTHLGICLYVQGRLEKACEAYSKSLDLAEEGPDALVNYGIALHALGKHSDAAAAFRRAVAVGLGGPGVIARLAESLAAAGDPAGSVAEIRRHLSQPPAGGAQAQEFWHLAEVARSLDALDEAIECYRRGLRGSPGDVKLNFFLGAALAEDDRLEEALASVDRALSLRPTYQSAIACKISILRRLGRQQEARELLDLDRDVSCRLLEVPSGHADLEEFNDALAERMLAEPSLRYEREGNATREGRHTDVLDPAAPGPLKDLMTAVEQAVGEHLEGLPRVPGHPLLGRRPASWRLQTWAVVMERGGHQVAHTHDDGYLSGVYYLRVPESVAGGGAGGCLELGRPADKLAGDGSHDVRLIRPRPGRLVIFPSYCVHRTVPLDTDETRISIAFDVVPLEWEPVRVDDSDDDGSRESARLAFLEKVSAGQIGHSGENLLDHLKGVRDVLAGWEERPELCSAGLFHSVYGTESFQSGPISADCRHEVSALIGKRAERLAWLFCVLRRHTLFDAVMRPEQGMRIQSREDDRWIELDTGELRDLIALTVANWVEQAERRPGDERLAPRPALLAMRPYLGDRPRAHFDRVCERMRHRNG